MKKQFLLASLISLVLMSCGGAQTNVTVGSADSTKAAVDTTKKIVKTDSVKVDSLAKK